MRYLLYAVQKDIECINTYLREAETEITQKNLQLLKALSAVTIVLLLLFFAITPLLLQRWSITVYHALLLPAAGGMLVLCMWYERKKKQSSFAVTGLCLTFQAVLFVFVTLIDAVALPTAPATFMPLLCIALPTLFILPRRLSYLMVGIFGGIYIAVVYAMKTPFLAQYDVFAVIVGIVFSFPVSQAVMRLRAQDHKLKMQYQTLSTQDSLVGILNKKTCIEASHRYIAASGQHVTCMLLVLDVDDFKCVNDRYGHYAGDMLLHAMGKILQETFRSTDIIGRFGGDEFIVLIKGVADSHVLSEKCSAIQKKLHSAAQNSCGVGITCSIGGVMAHQQKVCFDTLFRQADSALYLAKNEGKNRFIVQSLQAEQQ